MTLARVVYWLPRILGIAFICFLSLFALDVFQEGRGVMETAAALAIHLIPSAVLVVVLAVAWRWEWVGVVVFAGAGVFYWTAARSHPSWVLTISGPLFLVAALFLLSWFNPRLRT